MPIPDDYRTYLQQTRAVQKDERGREVLAGLTFSETHEYLAYLRNCKSHEPGGPSSERYLKLARQHARAARLAGRFRTIN
ncbi:hypothetical protein [Sphingomonas jatrophae]|uniref:Uncharacterized protein n=1 Tax=Sphingomonas jatrophae TaxID=1166337 RepID=A0A1I6JQC8_9SPHN|nr:hypothetical protein [Sphingomonas jatrophae]SFR81111.1 hypothetical protein SAMN05192580_0665 [Sphingomonas jatrophae]